MSEIAESTIFSKQNYIPRLHNTATLSLQHIVTRQCADTPTNPGQTNPGQTNPGHDKPWTGQTLDRQTLVRQTLDMTNPGQDKPWTGQTLDTTNPGQNTTGGMHTLGNVN
jgi:hypothetical protein